ncbi:uncharacterized protein CEXT_520671 [Caerostris extrusa]|uniref:Uncharacterized protein n=1 Tax=Caerostris extrusa TaxID=172846 RepID=A0AAV4N8G8_CAEEX|nr:uncharacterized protein CEXT_520671 [Caerostris extrusa]
MISLLKIFLAAVIVTCGYCFEIRARGNEDICPPSEQIQPCTCFRDSKSQRVTALCKNFTHAEDLKEIFDKNPNWGLEDIHIDNSIMAYLPAVMLEKSSFPEHECVAYHFVHAVRHDACRDARAQLVPVQCETDQRY